MGPLQAIDDSSGTALNPTLLAEVLSDSTEAYDRGTKFSHYRLIPSLQHVLLASQKKPRVECYTRSGDEWRLIDATDLKSRLELSALQISIALSRGDPPLGPIRGLEGRRSAGGSQFLRELNRFCFSRIDTVAI